MHKRTHLSAITILLGAVLSIITAIIINDGAGKEYNVTIGRLGLGVIVWCAVSMKKKTGTYMSLAFMFEFSFYILTLGQSLLYAFNIPVDTPLNLYTADTAHDVNTAYLFTMLCLLFLHLGMISYGKSGRIHIVLNHRKYRGYSHIDYSATMRTVGWLLFMVTLLPYAVKWYRLLGTYSVAGYAVAYSSLGGTTSWGKLFSLVGDYFPMVLFMLLASYSRDIKEEKYLIAAMILGIALLNFTVGNRSEPVCYIMAVLWFLRRYSASPAEKRRTTLLMLVGGLLLILIIPVIGETRNTGELSFMTVIRSFTSDESAFTVIRDTIIGMGWSAFPTVKTMQLIPERINYHYGQSYFFAALSVIPNLIGGTHISVKYAGLPQWLMETLHMTYGPGFSMPAEAYYNFGWLGIFAMPLIGNIVFKILDERDKGESAMRLFVMMAGFVLLFSIPRREMLTAIRSFVYYVGFLYLAVRVVYLKYNKEI